ncbi:hsp70 nucleotide exchange factor fes1 [Marasmius tenuissimus]|uniref:Hsp70 nucleotide exchange factor fes1 n=1 Tax=Marasmius tenuissimus TaxID=585030 RepID=A0ABR3A912_9AGAR|nr:hsp70 nucleotide exchange factor fes1 [Marasmius tenuissimus]
MESLLKWSIENSTPGNTGSAPAAPRSDLNPEIIDAILGKSDAEQMKDDMAIATDASRNEDERVNALDHLEMLIEQIDNANNLGKLKMWEPLHDLVTSQSSTDPVILQALWVIGTALQNNPAAQDSYLSLNPLAALTSFLSPNANVSPQIRSKAIYVLSGLLKHNANALSKLDDEDTDGWARLKQGLQDPDISVRRKVAFLLSTLLTPTESKDPSNQNQSNNFHTPNTQDQRNPAEPIHPNSHAEHLRNPSRVATSPIALKAVEKHGIVSTVIDGLTDPTPYGEDGDIEEPDADFEEKSVGILQNYVVRCDGQLSQKQKDDLKQWIQKEEKKEGEGTLAERWGLSSGEYKELVDKVQ